MALGLILALGGLGILIAAAGQFVKGAARLAVLYRVSPVVVGAVLIGFGTSAPEMVVSGIAAGRGDLDIGVGNIIGSNVANISLVLAAATAITVIPVDSRTLRREAPLSVASVIVFALVLQGRIERWEGALLAGLILVVLVLALRAARGDDPLGEDVEVMIGDDPLYRGLETVRVAGGLLAVVVSAWFIVEGAGRIADALDLSDGFVGFTLVALGTSAPELVTSVQAARQGETGLLVGNLLGSNVFNSLAVGGLVGLIGPGEVLDTRLAGTGSMLMLVVVIISWVFMVVGGEIDRRKGLILFLLWVVSVVILSGSDVADTALPLG